MTTFNKFNRRRTYFTDISILLNCIHHYILRESALFSLGIGTLIMSCLQQMKT